VAVGEGVNVAGYIDDNGMTLEVHHAWEIEPYPYPGQITLFLNPDDPNPDGGPRLCRAHPMVYYYDGPPVQWRIETFNTISVPQNYDAAVETPPSGYVTIYYSLDNLDGHGAPQLWAKADDGSTYQQN
jgi:hypothetical protein